MFRPVSREILSTLMSTRMKAGVELRSYRRTNQGSCLPFVVFPAASEIGRSAVVFVDFPGPPADVHGSKKRTARAARALILLPVECRFPPLGSAPVVDNMVQYRKE